MLAALVCAVATLAASSARLAAQEALQAGEAFVTRFSGTVEEDGRTVLDRDGTVGSIIDIRAPGSEPEGAHWPDEPQRHAVTAQDVGQVFGIALDDAMPPNIYLTATSAFGLHRNADHSDWMPGMWGADGGPGTIYRLRAANNYAPEVLARVTLDGRLNTGAALGNIAYDRWNRQLYVSDLETGMIHRLRTTDGFDLGAYDHGVTGRSSFLDMQSGETASLAPVAFDPATRAQVDDCPTGDVARTPSCWNFADFRRRVWGVGVRRAPLTGDVRLYYATWGSQGFGHPDHASAGDGQRNAIWSVRIGDDGGFDADSVRREFLLPDFFRSPEAIARAGLSQPVTDIAFQAFGDQDVMLLAERGGVRNLGLDTDNAFATPHEARVLRYELDDDDVWEPEGRYDVGYYERQEEGPPYIRAGSAGGVSFGMGYADNWEINPGHLDAFVWMSGDELCSDRGPCVDPDAEENTDISQVHGLQGLDEEAYGEIEPEAAFQPYPAPGPATEAEGPDSAFMVDVDTDVDAGRNDATRVGDIEVYQPAPDPGVQPEVGAWYGPWEESWPWPVPEEDYPPLPEPPTAEGWPELGIEKIPAECLIGEPCLVSMVITNNGRGAFEGPLHVLETPDGGDLAGVVSAGWTCEQPVSPGPIGCRSDWAHLAPGESTTLELLLAGYMFVLDEPLPEFVERTNCAFIIWPAALEGAARMRAIEAALLLRGHDPGPVDGIADAATFGAIEEFRLDVGLPPGASEEELFDALFPGTSGLPGDGVSGNDWNCAPMRFLVPDEDGAPGAGADEMVSEDIDLEMRTSFSDAQCHANGWCHFIFDIVNNGPEPFDGRLAIDLESGVPEGDAIPSGTIVVQPFYGWACAALDATVTRCIKDDVHIDPGANEATFGHFTIPGGYTAAQIENCAWFAWSESDLPDGDRVEGNDHACAVNSMLWDLAIEKQMSGTCFRANDCLVLITVTNVAGMPFDGLLVIHDTHFAEGAEVRPQLVDWQPAEWHCERPDGTIVCERPNTVLEQGDSVTLRLTVRFGNPGEVSDVAQIETFNINADNDTAEDSTNIIVENPDGDFDFQVGKTGPDLCLPGTVCLFTATVRNEGPNTHGGRLEIYDAVFDETGAQDLDITPGPATSADSSWSCVGGPGYSSCNTTVIDFFAGYETTVEMPVTIPEDYDGAFIDNCIRVVAPRDSYPAGNEACTRVSTRLAADLGVGAHVDGECVPGGECSVTIVIEHESGSVYTGELGLSGTLSAEDVVAGIEALDEGWVCEVTGPSTFECVHNPLTLPQGESQTFRLTLDIPESMAGESLTIGTEMFFPAGRSEVNDKNNEHRLVIDFPEPPLEAVPAADLAIRKVPRQGTCIGGQNCGFAMTVTNEGEGTFVGPLRVSDVITSDARLAASSPSPWSCRGSRGSYTCEHPSTTLEPGESLAFTVTFRTRSGVRGTMENCAEFAWSERSRVYAVQSALNALGFASGTPDGRIGPITRGAVSAFQERAGLEVTGRIDDELFEHLFESWGDGDGDAGNDRACTRIEVEAPAEEEETVTPDTSQPEASQPEACSGGRVRNSRGACVCPSNRPVWNGRRCVREQQQQQQQQEEQQPRQRRCSGGRVRNDAGRCVCPNNGIWTGIICIPRGQRQQEQQQEACTGGRYRNNKGQCVCPRRRPVWNGSQCVRRSQGQTPNVTPSPN